MRAEQGDFARTVLGVLFICLLIGASALIVKPFVGAGIWAGTIVVATWPLLLTLQRVFGGRRTPAVAVMTLLLLLVVIVPIGGVIGVLVSSAHRLAANPDVLANLTIPPPPAALHDVPLVGPDLAEKWGAWSAMSRDELAAVLQPYVADTVKWVIAKAGSAGRLLVQLLLTVIIASVLYAKGEGAAAGLRAFGRWLGGARGQDAVILAGRAIRGVALGVVVTALVQSGLAGLGLFVAGVPFALALTGLALVLCIAQVGPALILLPAIGWLFTRGDTGSAILLVVFAIPAVLLDNVLRPVLIRKGADLPLLLVFTGVIGGIVTLGLIGVFVGPVVLAVAYTLLSEWSREEEPARAAPAADAAPAEATAGAAR